MKSKTLLSIKLTVSIIFLSSLLLSNCAVYKDMKRTGHFTVKSRDLIDANYFFRLVQRPSRRRPVLVLKLRSSITYQEERAIEYSGLKRKGQKLVHAFIWGGLGVSLLGYTVVDTPDSIVSTVGLVIAATGFVLYGLYYNEWESYTTSKPGRERVVIRNEFNDIIGRRVQITAASSRRKWYSQINRDGKITVDLEEIITRNQRHSNLNFFVSSYSGKGAVYKYTIPRSLISYLTTPANFRIKKSIIPNDPVKLHEVRRGKNKDFILELSMQNNGDFKLYNLELKLTASKGVLLQKESFLLEEVHANSTIENLYFPFSLDRNLRSTKVAFTIILHRNKREHYRKKLNVDLGRRR